MMVRVIENGSLITIEKWIRWEYKAEQATVFCTSISTPQHLSQRNKDLCSHKNLYKTVYSSFIRSGPKLEISFNG